MDALLTTLSSVFWVAVVLGILVTIHELGHFLSARLFGMRVDAFSVGFGKAIVKRTVGDTEYRLSWIPLGGYVKIAGMVDESLDVPYEQEPALHDDGTPVLDEAGEPVWRDRLDAQGRRIPTDSTPAPDEFRAKPVWQRMVVISAGVVFNLVLAFVVYAGLAMAYPRVFTPAANVALDVTPGSIAAEMGFRTGDRIAGVNGEPVEGFEEVFDPNVIATSPLTFDVRRGDARASVTAPDDLVTRLSRAQRAAAEAGGEATLGSVFGVEPRFPPVLSEVVAGSPAAEAGLAAGDRILSVDGARVASWAALTTRIAASGGRPMQLTWLRGADSLSAAVTPRQSGERYLLGIALDATTLGVEQVQLGPVDAIGAGWQQTVATTSAYFGFVGKLVTGRESVRESMGGPLVIARESARAAERGAQSFWEFLAYLSVALAVFNILPIPALDGGHLVFLVYEAVARREPSLKVRMVVQQVGMVLLLALMAFVVFNDALRLFG